MTRRLARVALPAVLLASGGCLATKGDMARLQQEMRSSSSASAASATSNTLALRVQNDSLARASATAVSAAFGRLDALIKAQDVALRDFRQAFDAYRRSNTDSMRQVQRDIGNIKAMVDAQSGSARTTNATIEKLTATLEALSASNDSLRSELGRLRMTGGGGSPLPDSTEVPVPTAAPPPGVPGPNQLLIQGTASLARQSYSSARRSFQLLIDTYTADTGPASEAQLYIGQSYKEEGNTAAADSVYRLVYTRYPEKPAAGSALYRRGVLLADQLKKPDEARVLFERVVRDYQKTEAYQLACIRLNRPNC